MKISVIIPVLNEQERIGEIISELKDCEIIVSDCNGRTLDAVHDEHVVRIISEAGRGAQLKAGAEAASGDVLLFLHADTSLPHNWQKLVTECLSVADAGSFSLGINDSRIFFRVIEFFTSLRCRLTKTPYGDQAIFMTRKCYDSVGGYRDYPIFEDVAIMEDVRAKGFKIMILRDKVLTSARRWKEGGLIRTTLRNRLINLLYLCGVSPNKLNRIYRSI